MKILDSFKFDEKEQFELYLRTLINMTSQKASDDNTQELKSYYQAANATLNLVYDKFEEICMK